jgi:hypothetical protein
MAVAERGITQQNEEDAPSNRFIVTDNINRKFDIKNSVLNQFLSL